VQLQSGKVSEPSRRTMILDCSEDGDPRACPGYGSAPQETAAPGSAAKRYLDAMDAMAEEVCRCVGSGDPTCSQQSFGMDTSCIVGVLNRYENQMQSQLDCAMGVFDSALQCIRNAACNQTAMQSCLEFMTVGPGSGSDPLSAACGQFPASFNAEMDACSPSGPTFVCDNGEEIDADWQCDGMRDCEDGSDEVGCDTASASDGSVPTSYFQCGDGEIIPAALRCDGDTDCEDGSDEVGCP
jgi:hypothetical protein